MNINGPVAQWITRLPTEQKIAGSIPAWIDNFVQLHPFLVLKFYLKIILLIYCRVFLFQMSV